MPNLSIKHVPESVVAKLRMRAAANHRSLQGELMALVCQAVEATEPRHETPAPEHSEGGWKSLEQVVADHKALRRKPVTKGPRAVDIIRQERDSR